MKTGWERGEEKEERKERVYVFAPQE